MTPGELERVNELNWSTVLKTNAANLSPRELERVKDLNWSNILAPNNCFEALSSDKEDSKEDPSGIHNDKTVKTSPDSPGKSGHTSGEHKQAVA